jgi:hypothetical protein
MGRPLHRHGKNNQLVKKLISLKIFFTYRPTYKDALGYILGDF